MSQAPRSTSRNRTVHLRTLVGCAVVLTLLLVPVSAHATITPKQVESIDGSTGARLTWNEGTDSKGMFVVTDVHLVIARNGAVALDSAISIGDCDAPTCWPAAITGSADGPPLLVRDLDGDDEAEVAVGAYTGGAHCCTVLSIWRVDPTTGAFAKQTHMIGDPTVRIRRVDSDGVAELVTRDDRFAYLYSSYAGSYLPVSILHVSGTHLVDVTSSFPGAVAFDAKQAWKQARSACSTKDMSETTGMYAGWAADRYRLGHRVAALRTLRREVARGCLRAPSVAMSDYLRKLDLFLRRGKFAPTPAPT